MVLASKVSLPLALRRGVVLVSAADISERWTGPWRQCAAVPAAPSVELITLGNDAG